MSEKAYDARGNLLNGKYLYKESVVLGKLNDPEGTITYWRNHINGKLIRKYADLFGGRVLDVGCNIGMATLQLASLPQVEYVVGLDLLWKAIEDAQIYLAYRGLDHKVEFRVADFCDLDVGALGRFDGGVSFHTLEHIFPQDIPLFMMNLARLLKLGAVALFSLPNGKNFGSGEHKSMFDDESLPWWFEQFGFETKEVFVHSVYHTEYVEVPPETPGDGKTCLTGLFVKMKAVDVEFYANRTSLWEPHVERLAFEY